MNLESPQNPSDSASFGDSWGHSWFVKVLKNVRNMCISRLWTRLERTQAETIRITRAHRRLYGQSDPKARQK